MKLKTVAVASFISLLVGGIWLNNSDSKIALILTAAGFIGCVLSYVVFKKQKQSNNNLNP